jgi:hypothetical protein
MLQKHNNTHNQNVQKRKREKEKKMQGLSGLLAENKEPRARKL